MRTARLLAGLALAVAVALALAIGCARRDAEPEGNGAIVDMELMAFLSEARALHHQANLREEAGDLPGAAASMDRLVHARRPHDGRTPEVEEVLADAYARLAEVELRQDALDRAAAAVKAGLDHAPDATYFRGHLLEVEGLIMEARASTLADAGRGDEARAARDRAIALLEEVVRIQDQVIQRSLAAREARAKEAGR
jgi:tetratricopeptide (TPR) repeat protein